MFDKLLAGVVIRATKALQQCCATSCMKMLPILPGLYNDVSMLKDNMTLEDILFMNPE